MSDSTTTNDGAGRFECRLCGLRATFNLPWRGRPQGPQCQCNPNTWGNWRRVNEPGAPPAEAKGK